MNEFQKSVVRCAFADLCGAAQAYKQRDMRAHDWDAHMETILELKKAFDFLDDPVPADLLEDVA